MEGRLRLPAEGRDNRMPSRLATAAGYIENDRTLTGRCEGIIAGRNYRREGLLK